MAQRLNCPMCGSKLIPNEDLVISDKVVFDLDKLKTAVLINEKMGKRLQAIIDLRESEESNGEPSLEELLKEFDTEE